jgi:hypothetical protein
MQGKEDDGWFETRSLVKTCYCIAAILMAVSCDEILQSNEQARMRLGYTSIVVKALEARR